MRFNTVLIIWLMFISAYYDSIHAWDFNREKVTPYLDAWSRIQPVSLFNQMETKIYQTTATMKRWYDYGSKYMNEHHLY